MKIKRVAALAVIGVAGASVAPGVASANIGAQCIDPAKSIIQVDLTGFNAAKDHDVKVVVGGVDSYPVVIKGGKHSFTTIVPKNDITFGVTVYTTGRGATFYTTTVMCVTPPKPDQPVSINPPTPTPEPKPPKKPKVTSKKSISYSTKSVCAKPSTTKPKGKAVYSRGKWYSYERYVRTKTTRVVFSNGKVKTKRTVIDSGYGALCYKIPEAPHVPVTG